MRGNPSFRVNRIMKRLSRDTYMRPEDVRIIAEYICKKISPCAWSSVMKHAFAEECIYVGMINGYPPAFAFEPSYKRIFNAVSKSSRRSAGVELALLRSIT